MIKLNKFRVIGIVILFIISFFIYFQYKVSPMAVEGWSETVSIYSNSKSKDSLFKQKFLNTKNYTNEYRYQELFKYFAYGNFKYRSPKGAFVYYPGAISARGRDINALEGFARFFPLAASWLYSTNSQYLSADNTSYNLIENLKEGLVNGTDPKSKEYWGDVHDKNQRIVEAADIALGLWISKDKIWADLQIHEKDRIVKWLEQSINKEIVDNNWNLFPITIVKVLEALNYAKEKDLIYINKLYNDYKLHHYLGEGWFDDPPKGIDYYNAWSIHYSLFWIDQIDPYFDRKFIRQAHSDFVEFYKYFFSENGFPIMGRSVCYRLAAPSPIVSAALITPQQVSPGLAMRTLDLTWIHFVENDAVKNGKLTQGYYDDDLRLLDGYSGAGSCLWSLRSLIVAFYVNKHISLWESNPECLPIEQSDFNILNKTIGWQIEGDNIQQKISLKINQNVNNEHYELINYGTMEKLKEFLIKKPFRPNNQDALYKNYIYSNSAEIILKH